MGRLVQNPIKNIPQLQTLLIFLSSCPNYGAVTCARRPALLLPDNIVVPYLLNFIKPSITSKHSRVFDNTLTEDSSINCITKYRYILASVFLFQGKESKDLFILCCYASSHLVWEAILATQTDASYYTLSHSPSTSVSFSRLSGRHCPGWRGLADV